MRRKKFSSSDQLDIFNDRTFEKVDNAHTNQTQSEDLRKKLLLLIGYLGFSPELVQEDWVDVLYLLDANIKRKSLEARLYTLDIAYLCVQSNSIVCLDRKSVV